MNLASPPATHSPPTYRALPPPSPLVLPKTLLPSAPPGFLIRLVLGLRRFLMRWADRLCPADLVLFDYSTGVGNTALLGAAARYGIADYLAERGPGTAEAIAQGLGLNADVLHRTLRTLANMGIFAMTDAGVFSNNRISLALRSGLLSRSREWLLYFASGSNMSAWRDFPEALETGEGVFKWLHGVNVWQWFESHADEREMFAHCMLGLTAMDAPVIAQLYPFREVTRVCDVGGGRGILLSEIALRHPHIQGILHDSPGVVASARTILEQRGVAQRIELQPGSFFESVPTGCDIYLMKNILHDWDDATCIQILRNVRRAAAAGVRVLLCESVVERCSRDLLATRADLHMLVACDNGRERGLEEFRSLLEAAGFRYRRSFGFPTITLIEGEVV